MQYGIMPGKGTFDVVVFLKCFLCLLILKECVRFALRGRSAPEYSISKVSYFTVPVL